jgi:hypothetical protein
MDECTQQPESAENTAKVRKDESSREAQSAAPKSEFKLERLADYSDEALLAEVKRVAALIPGDKLSQAAFLKHSLVHWSTLTKRFGKWRRALELAGLGDRCDDSNQRLSETEILRELRSVAELLKTNSPTERQFAEHGQFSRDTIRNHFGSWRRALEKAGLQQCKGGMRYSDEECYENLLKVWIHYGRPPRHDEMNHPPSNVGSKAYVSRWTTWNKALHAFVQKVESESEPPTASAESAGPTPLPSDEPKLKSRPCSVADRRDIPLGLRFRVLTRDRFRCVLCGASPATDLSCEIQVDHIAPVAGGGKTVVENLRTTCAACNLGKGKKTEAEILAALARTVASPPSPT